MATSWVELKRYEGPVAWSLTGMQILRTFLRVCFFSSRLPDLFFETPPPTNKSADHKRNNIEFSMESFTEDSSILPGASSRPRP